MNIVTISPKGQITIPKEFREGMPKQCLFEKKGSSIIIRPIKIELIGDEIADFGLLATKSFEFWENTADDVYQEFYN